MEPIKPENKIEKRRREQSQKPDGLPKLLDKIVEQSLLTKRKGDSWVYRITEAQIGLAEWAIVHYWQNEGVERLYDIHLSLDQKTESWYLKIRK